MMCMQPIVNAATHDTLTAPEGRRNKNFEEAAKTPMNNGRGERIRTSGLRLPKTKIRSSSLL